MKYPQISSLAPEGEQFDSTAVNEGVWATETHLDAIENRLAENATAIAGHQTAVDALNMQITSITGERDAARTELQTANTTIATRDAKIVELENSVAELKKAKSNTPGEEATNTSREKDEANGGTKADPFMDIAASAFPGMKTEKPAAAK